MNIFKKKHFLFILYGICWTIIVFITTYRISPIQINTLNINNHNNGNYYEVTLISSPESNTKDIINYQDNTNSAIKIDVVYLWANGSDQNYVSIKQEYQRKYGIDVSAWCPTTDHGELLLSLRSLYKYGELQNWLGNIYIISTNKQKPYWLNINHPKIHIINDIDLLDVQHSFNSHSLYAVMHKIPNLSKYFLEFDDDFILTRNNTLDDFFWLRNSEIVAEKNGVHSNKRSCQPDNPRALVTQCNIAKSKLKQNIKWALHKPRVWNISRIKQIWTDFPLQMLNTTNNPFRTIADIDMTSFYPLYTKWKYATNYIVTDKFKQLRTSWYTELIKLTDFDDELWDIFINQGSVPLQDTVKNTSYDEHQRYFANEQLPIVYYMVSKKLKLDSKVPFEIDTESLCALNCNNHIEIMGHRGIGWNLFDEETIPECTIPHLKMAHDFGIEWVEIDISPTKDNILIVHHTERNLFKGCKDIKPFMRNVNVRSKTYQEIKDNYRYQYKGEPLIIPTLKEYLLIAKQYNIGVQIELKYNTLYRNQKICNPDPFNKLCTNMMNDTNNIMIKNLVQILNEINVDNDKIIVSSFEGPKLYNFNQQYLPLKTHTALILGTNIKFTDEYIKQLDVVCKLWNVDNVSIFIGTGSKEIVQKLKDIGLRVQIGMPGGSNCIHEIKRPFTNRGDERKDLELAIAYNPDAICTNQPILAATIRDGFAINEY